MNNKLKIVLKRGFNEQGFVLPIAVGMGLVMILVAVTMIMRSQGDQVSASAQKTTNQSLSAAEAGVTRYQTLINNNRVIAGYPKVGTPGWTTSINIPGIVNCSGSVTTGSTVVTNAATANWQDVDSSDSTKGQYKLIDYNYSPSPGFVPGVGTLTIKGRVNQVDANNNGDDNDDDDVSVSTANTKLVVEIPVKAGSLNSVVAGLWVKNSTITDMGSDKVNGNILINSCPPAVGATSANLYNSSTQEVIARPMTFPDTPALPPARANGSNSYYTLTSSPFNQTFPLTGDQPASDGYYHYLVDNLESSGNGRVTISSGKKVIFYLRGNIDLSGNPNMNDTSGNTVDQLQIYGNTYTSASTTKYGCGSLRLGTDCPTLKAHFNGNGTMKAFVHAPAATGSVNGGGNTNGNFIGSLWLKDWDSSSGNSKVKIDASGNYDDFLVSQNIITSPLISPISSWKRE